MSAHPDERRRALVADVWRRALAPPITAVTIVMAATLDGTITVLVPSPGWLRHLDGMRELLLLRINHALLKPGRYHTIRWHLPGQQSITPADLPDDDEETRELDLGLAPPDAWKGNDHDDTR